jgi:predicted nicotinamide N-methyase
MTASSPTGQGTESLGSLKIPGGWTVRTQVIGDHSFDLLLPADPYEFLNQLDESTDPDLADPFWAAIWSAAPALAERVVGKCWPPGMSALELGCGVGLPGLGALAAGMSVTFSDYIPLAVRLALENAHRNGFSAATGFQLDWHKPPAVKPFPLVLASDVLYEQQLHADLLTTLDRVLAPDGECWIGDPLRSAATDFARLARQRGYHVTIDRDDTGRDDTGRALADNQLGFQLLILRRCPA